MNFIELQILAMAFFHHVLNLEGGTISTWEDLEPIRKNCWTSKTKDNFPSLCACNLLDLCDLIGTKACKIAINQPSCATLDEWCDVFIKKSIPECKKRVILEETFRSSVNRLIKKCALEQGQTKCQNLKKNIKKYLSDTCGLARGMQCFEIKASRPTV